MSFLDSRLVFWNNQAITAAVQSMTAHGFFDMEENGATDSQLGWVWLNILIGTAEDGTCASGGYFQLLTSDAVGFNTGASGASTAKTGGEQAIACIGSEQDPLYPAELQAGKRFSIAVPLRVLMKYVQLEWVIVSESAGAMTVDAWLGMEPLSDLNIQKEPS